MQLLYITKNKIQKELIQFSLLLNLLDDKIDTGTLNLLLSEVSTLGSHWRIGEIWWFGFGGRPPVSHCPALVCIKETQKNTVIPVGVAAFSKLLWSEYKWNTVKGISNDLWGWIHLWKTRMPSLSHFSLKWSSKENTGSELRQKTSGKEDGEGCEGTEETRKEWWGKPVDQTELRLV